MWNIAENQKEKIPKNTESLLITQWITYQVKNYVEVITFWDIEYYLKDTNNFDENDIEKYLKELDKVINNLKNILEKEQKYVSYLVKEEMFYEKEYKFFNKKIIDWLNSLRKLQIFLKWEKNALINIVYTIELMKNNVIILNQVLINFIIKQTSPEIMHKIDELNKLLSLLLKTYQNAQDSNIRLNKLIWRPFKLKWTVNGLTLEIKEENIRIK